MNEKLNEAMSEIRDEYIVDAAKPKRRFSKWIGAVAAVLAVVIMISAFVPPMTLQASAISLAEYPDYQRQHWDTDHASTQLREFFTASMGQTLSETSSENAAYSPMNVYMALAVLAELTTGNARQQILDALGIADMDTLRSNTNTLWNATYYDDKDQRLLANSLWLDQKLDFDQTVMDTLAETYYTSAYRGDLDGRQAARKITIWLDQQTGDLLKTDTSQISLNPDTVLALYSTVYFQAKWDDLANDFQASKNTDGLFHSPDGDVVVTFMNKRLQSYYYWGVDFGAACLRLEDGSTMWLFLPDEGKTVDDVLHSEEYADVLYGTAGNNKHMFINLSIPKFDVRQSCDLKADLQQLGITDVFDQNRAAFAQSVYGTDVFLTAANQVTRVAIDEDGVTAASYIELPGAAAAAPPEDEIDFVLDRPFLFVIMTPHDLPLFAGVVNAP